MAQLCTIVVYLSSTNEPAGHLSISDVGDWSPRCGIDGYSCPARRNNLLGKTFATPEAALTALLDHLHYVHGVVL
jgi:hypothetical protein